MVERIAICLGYPTTGLLRYRHLGLGAATILLVALELRQDRNLNEKQLAKHGMYNGLKSIAA